MSTQKVMGGSVLIKLDQPVRPAERAALPIESPVMSGEVGACAPATARDVLVVQDHVKRLRLMVNALLMGGSQPTLLEAAADEANVLAERSRALRAAIERGTAEE